MGPMGLMGGGEIVEFFSFMIKLSCYRILFCNRIFCFSISLMEQFFSLVYL